MLLGSSRILSENRDLVDGEVLLIFEQGEEMGAGIFGVAETIYTEKPDTLWGIHVKADFPSGKVSVEPGARMAAALGIKGKIIGRGGHGSRPDLAINPLNCFTDIYQAFRNMKADYISPFSATTFSIGQVEYGTSGNIISDTLTFAGTVRFTDIEVGRAAASRMQKIVHDICELHGCKYELNKLTATDMRVYNNEVCSKIATEAITEVLGSDVHMHKDPWMASESMGIYMKYVPSVFEFLGIANEEKGMGADHHNPSFEIDESALKLGTASTVQYTLNFMKEKPEIDFVPPDLPPSELIKALFGL
jgi:amidohydrolase